MSHVDASRTTGLDAGSESPPRAGMLNSIKEYLLRAYNGVFREKDVSIGKRTYADRTKKLGSPDRMYELERRP